MMLKLKFLVGAITINALVSSMSFSHGSSHSHQVNNVDDSSISQTFETAKELQTQHQFVESRKLLEKILAYQPNHQNALLLHASVLNVMGDYTPARKSCQKLFRVANSLTAISCLSSLGIMSGKPNLGYKLLDKMLHDQLNTQISVTDLDEFSQWSTGIAAELAWSLGKFEEAQQHFINAGAQRPRSLSQEVSSTQHYLTLSYSDFLLSQNQYQEVIQLLTPIQALEEIQLRLARAYQELGDPRWQPMVNDLVHHYAQAPENHPHHREAAMSAFLFLSNDNISQQQQQKAIHLATHNWNRQKEKIDAKLLLETAIKSKSPDAARPVLSWIDTYQIKDLELVSLASKIQHMSASMKVAKL